MKKDVTILVNSCDLYYDAWEPFFELFKRHWSDCQYEVILNTETIKYEGKITDINTINTKEGIPWSKRLKRVIRQIDSKYIMFFLEDEFLRSPVNNGAFEDTVQFMDDNPDVGYILMRHSEKQKHDLEDPYFERKEITEKYQIVCLSALYRKEFLLEILRDHESPWEFEAYATERLSKTNWKALQYNKSMPCIFDYDDSTATGYGLRKGKWQKLTKPLLDSFGIYVNYDNLGWFEEQDIQVKRKERWIIRKKNKFIYRYRRWKSLR